MRTWTAGKTVTASTPKSAATAQRRNAAIGCVPSVRSTAAAMRVSEHGPMWPCEAYVMD